MKNDKLKMLSAFLAKSRRLTAGKQLPQKKPSELFNTEFPPPELKKVDLPPQKTVIPDIGFWDLLWLLIKSVLRNKAHDAMEGKPVIAGEMAPPRLLTIFGWWKLVVGVIVVGALSFLLYYLYTLIF